MRLFVFTENYAKGGGNRYLTDVINGVPPQFGEIVLASNPGGIYTEDLARIGPAVRSLALPILTSSRLQHALHPPTRLLRFALRLALTPLEPVFFLYNVGYFYGLLGQLRPDLVWSASGGYPSARSTLALLVAAKLRGIFSLLSVVSMPAPRDRTFYPLHALLDALVSLSVGRVVVNANAIKEAIVHLRHLPAERVSILHNGLPDTGVQRTGGGQGEQITLGLISRLDKEKGVFVLLDAFKRLSALHPNLFLRLVGHGNASQQLAARVQQEGLADKVRFEGFYDGDIAELISSFDLYAFPSLYEGFPYSLLEAMRAGLPIVASAVGGVPEAIADGQDGLLVPPADVDALTKALEKLISNAASRQELGRNARARFESDFAIEKMHDKVSQLMVECHGGRS